MKHTLLGIIAFFIFLSFPTSSFAATYSCSISVTPTTGTTANKYTVSGTGKFKTSLTKITLNVDQYENGNRISSSGFFEVELKGHPTNERTFGPVDIDIAKAGKHIINYNMSKYEMDGDIFYRGPNIEICKSSEINISTCPNVGESCSTICCGGASCMPQVNSEGETIGKVCLADPKTTSSPTRTCNPSGIDPKDSFKCADKNCELVGKNSKEPGQCVPKTVIAPTIPLTHTPVPPTPPCADKPTSTTPQPCKSFGISGFGDPIPTDPFQFIKRLFAILLGLAGGIAMVMILASGYQLMTAQGSKEGIQGAKDRITSAIVGLLFLVFSMVILQVIGVDILSIPGFSK